MDENDGVLASRLEVVSVAEVEGLLVAAGAAAPFSAAEVAYAQAKSDPARRLAARLAAKRAAAQLLGGAVTPADVEVIRGAYGPPALRLSPRGRQSLRERGAARLLVSLTHERAHAAALVVLVSA
ncbi:MAG TPA: holo-ACP synthase [Vicinamibacteria bacterium]|nr:holo-ACP synthase [Vicinamibacteria bacterium]